MVGPAILVRRPARNGAWLELRVTLEASGCLAEDGEKPMAPAGVLSSGVDEAGSADFPEGMVIASGLEVGGLLAALNLVTRLEEPVLVARRVQAESDVGDKPGPRCSDD
ncbi:hypothetical protein TKK_0000122 [Trichogramma kaykai]